MNIFEQLNPNELPTIEQLKAAYTQFIFNRAKGQKTRAAKILGIDRRTMYRSPYVDVFGVKSRGKSEAKEAE